MSDHASTSSRPPPKRPAPAPSPSPSPSPSATGAAAGRRPINFNSPKAIFLTWTGLVFVAGFGYFTVKSNNTQKKREFMLRRGQSPADAESSAEVGNDVQPGYTPGNNERFSQSPLQSLTSAFTRQTDQRSRTREPQQQPQQS